jgi:aldehyde dehydrogenase (NAD+)
MSVDTTPVPRSAEVVTSAADVVNRMRSGFESGRTRSWEWREAQLRGLLKMMKEREAEFLEAVSQDLQKPKFEGWAAELGATAREVKHTIKHMRSWGEPERTKVPFLVKPGKATVVREPLGVALVIAPWNYPIHLALTPLAAALAAGNTVVVKPSEVAPATSAALATWLPRYLDNEAVAVVEGGVEETTALLEERFDHILYTGNGSVGRIVAAAAAKHLTPCTLELGGKTPVIVDKDANLHLAAGRVAFAKWSNAGQTCVAADHVYVHADVEHAFLEALKKEIDQRYGADPRASVDFARVVNERHTGRIQKLLDHDGHEVVAGGHVDVADRYVAPTVLRGIAFDAPIMQEEIFGPVLPVLTFDDITEPIAAINAGDKPLALYIFTASDETADRVLAETSAGGVCVNDVMSHLFVPGLPFGGVGESGYGAYHGRWGFETFSHRKSVLRRPSKMKESAAMRAPYKPWKMAVLRRFL